MKTKTSKKKVEKKKKQEKVFCKKCEKRVSHIDWIDGYCDKCIDI